MSLLGEPEHVARERETLSTTLAVLKKSYKLLRRDPNLATTVEMAEEEILTASSPGEEAAKKKQDSRKPKPAEK